MTCSICGRGNCTASFHSLDEQEKHDELFGEYEYRIGVLRDEVERLAKENAMYWDVMTHEQKIQVTGEEE